MAARPPRPRRPASRASRGERARRQPGNHRHRAGSAWLDHGAGETAATDDDVPARRHPRPHGQRQRHCGAETAVSTRIETTVRATIPSWARAGLALLAIAGLVALAVLRPRLPTMPWQPLQPTTDEFLRQAVLFLVWLLLAVICVRLAWLALKPPRRAEAKTYAAPSWLPERRRARLVTERPDSRELLHLFSRPRSVSLTEIGLASEASDALESQT